MRTFAVAAAAALALAGCGRDTPAENTAEALEEAAEVSTPAARDVLENAAEQIEAGNVAVPGAAAQQALEAAGNAQAPPPGNDR